jgi:hypothetical protein
MKNTQFINKKDFQEHLCKDCKSKQFSVGFKNEKICEETCLTIKVLKKEKTYKTPTNNHEDIKK